MASSKRQKLNVHTEREDDDESIQDGDELGQDQDEQLEHQQHKSKIKIALKAASNVCKVCGKGGHSAGFVGSVYVDCINKPCYLCKTPGHTTASCPYRVISPGFGVRPASAGPQTSVARSLAMRELSLSSSKTQTPLPPRLPKFQVLAAIMKLHSRRVTALEFHPNYDNVVVSADKKGCIAAWDFAKVKERTLYTDCHKYLVAGMKHVPWFGDPTFATASADGTTKLLDLETGLHHQMLDLNPNGFTTEKDWKMNNSVDVSTDLKAVLVGDNDGRVHVLDPRQRSCVTSMQLHKKGNKVAALGIHPLEARLFASGSNDHSVRLFDVRGFCSSLSDCSKVAREAEPNTPDAPGSGAGSRDHQQQPQKRPQEGGKHIAHHAEIAMLPHPRVVNAVAFSPITGQRLLTTCQDNRLRVWDSSLSACNGDAASREIVHSHDFNRYLSPFKAEWDPKDLTESSFVIGRYISEDHGGVALHAVDIINACNGSLMAQLFDYNLPTISPVNKPHPNRDLIVSGSSRSLFLWSPVTDDDDEGLKQQSPGAHKSAAAESSTAFERRQLQPRIPLTLFDADPDSDNKKKPQKKGGKGKGKGAESESD